MRRMRLGLAAALSAALIAALPGGVLAFSNTVTTDGGSPVAANVDSAYALVQLVGAPVATSVKTKPAQGKKIDLNSTAVKSYKAELSALRNSFKQWLQVAAPKAQVVKGYDLSLNAVAVKLNGTSLATIRTSSLVLAAQYESIYHPAASDPDLGAISASAGWANIGATAATAGSGVKVGVIDTGIDITNPCFSDAGYPAIAHLGQTKYTNNKVFVARVFNNKVNQNGFDAAPIQAHGTHVAGTIACNAGTDATVAGVAIPYKLAGVAPHALLGNYNIFPGNVENARSEDILNALEAAYADRMDVVNMSLGGGQQGVQDLLTVAIDNLDRANMISAVAAGNSGPGFSTVESPGSATRALTAGASTVNHTVANELTVGTGSPIPAVFGDFGTPASYPVDGTLAVLSGTGVSGLSLACSPLAAVTGAKIAVVQRGTCDFTTKVANAQAAGYSAVVVVNRLHGPAIPMGQNGAPNQPTIPAWMISLDDVATVLGQTGTSASISAPSYVSPFGAVDVMGDFSSQGPTNVDFRVKPDVTAPGVNVLSSIPSSFCDGSPCFAFFQGTSMATPHLAGAAAVVRQQHPDWAAWQVRSAIVNTADAGVLAKSDYSGAVEKNVNVTGAGRLNLDSATTAEVVLDSVSVAFGAIPSGSGQTRSQAVVIKNVSGATATFSLAIAAWGSASGVAFGVDTSSVTLANNASATVHVIVAASKAASMGSKQAWLTVSNGDTVVAHAAVYALVK